MQALHTTDDGVRVRIPLEINLYVLWKFTTICVTF